jgi:hypothetical protein
MIRKTNYWKRLFANTSKTVTKGNRAQSNQKKPRMDVELLEDRLTPSTTITQWAFSGSSVVTNSQNGSTQNSLAVVPPTTGTGTLITLGMYNTYNGGNTASDDVISTAGTVTSSYSEYLLRVRGASHNGWATHAAGAAQYTQGIEADASTVGFSNVTFSFDWYSTTQGIRDLQFQYNLNVTNASGWTNYGGTSPTGTYIATPNDYYNASSPPGTITVDMSGIAGANNDANFGVRLVSAYDSTGNVPNDYASATLSSGLTVIYNNNSGNWRFGNLTFAATQNSSTIATSSAVTGSPVSPQNPGTTVTLTDTITPASGSANATGTVQFYDGATPIGTPQAVSAGTGNTGVATLAVNTGGSPLTLGSHSFSAVYTPTGGVFLTSTSPAFHYTIGDPTSSVVTAAPSSPQSVGTNVTFTDTITPANIGGTSSSDGTPTGSVQFYDGTTAIGSPVTVTAGTGVTGVASYSTSLLVSGTHNISAVYSPTGNFLTSTSPTVGYALYSGTPGPYTPGNLILLQAGDGVNNYNAQAPLYLDEITTSGANVQQDSIPAVGAVTITAASESGTTVTITTGNAAGMTGNGFTTGETIAIAGISPGGYDGTFVITTTGTNSFTYTATSGLGAATITGATATPGQVGNQPITIDLSAAAGNGQLSRSYDGSALSFDGVDSTINNGGLTSPATPTGSNNRDVAIVSGDPTITSNINTTTDGPFYVGDDNRGSVAESPTGPIYTAGHPNQAGGAVSQGVHEFDTTGPSIGTQVSASTNIRGVTIGFDNRMYFSTASGLGGAAALNAAGIFTEAAALPNSTNTPTVPANDIMVVPAIFGASKLGGVFLADMNGDGIIDNGDRLYFVDDGTVGGAGTGGLYVSTWNTNNTNNPWNTPNNAAAAAAGFLDYWSAPVRLGDAPVQTGSGGVGQLRGLTGTVINSTTAVLYTTAYDNTANDSSIIQQWTDATPGVAIASASETGSAVTITTMTPNTFTTGQVVQIDGVGANSGAGAITSGYNGAWSITVVDSTHFTYTDTNSGGSGLGTVTNQGAAGVTVAGNIIEQLAAGSDTINGKTYGEIGLRGIAFAPVAATSVTLSQSPANPLTPGSPVTLTATLTNSEVLPTGTVTFIDLNTNTILGQGTISTTGGVTTASFTTTLVGNHYVSAYFSGGGALALASARSNTIQVIESGSTASTTSVVSSPTAVAIAKQVTLTATVTSGATGTVSFFSGSVSLANLLGNSAVSAGTATLTTAFGTAGSVTIIAVYNGDNTYASSQGSTTVNVAANATATITTSANNVALNATPTYTVTVNGNSTLGVPAGTVVFTIISATTNSSGHALVSQSSSAITLTPGSGNTATATWTSPALSASGSYFVTVAYTATGGSNPYSSFAVNTTSATSGVALIETVLKAFTPGNIVVVQRGDGTVNLGSSAYPVFLDEYTTGGALVQSIALPNVDAGTQHSLFLSGQNGAEGLINRSANGAFITLSGYDLPVGHTFITSTFPYQYPRSIAELGLNGLIDTSTAISTTQVAITAASESGTTVTITTATPSGFTMGEQLVITGISPSGYDGQVTVTSASGTTFTYTAASGLGSATLSSAFATSAAVPYNPLDVVSYDGQEFWLASNLPVGDTTDSGIEYVSALGATGATQLGASNSGAAAISISGGQLYITKGSGNVQAVGTGLPTTVGQTLSGLPNLSNAYGSFFPNAENPEQVLLLNTNDGTTNNPNVLYIADQSNGILKFYLNNAAISSLSESGTTVTVALSAPPGTAFTTGDQVQIAGASVAGYNGLFTITVVDGTHFTYTATASGLVAATGGTASEWLFGKNGTGSFGEKLIFAGGATGITGFVNNPGSSATVQLYLTGSNVQQQNPNQINSFLDTNVPSQGFPSGNVTVLGFVGGQGGAGSPNGNENFAGIAFVPGYSTTTTVTSPGTGIEGQVSTFTATVTSAGGNTPTGVVIFSVDGVAQPEVTLNGSGVATLSIALSLGTHTITAAYQGDVKDDTSVGSLVKAFNFSNGNVLVTQVGTGSGALSGTGTSTYLDEYTPTGTSTGTQVALSNASTLTATITTISESGTTATATTMAAHGFATGEKVTIAGSSVSGYNATFTITAVTSTTFTFTATSGLGSASGGTASVTNYLTELGTTTTEGYLTDATDGHTVSIAGYNVAPGTSNSGVNRDIGLVGPSGSVDISTQLPSGTGSTRVAISADGLGFWVATSSGVRYVPFANSGAASTQLTSEVGSPTAVGIFDGQLWGSAGAGAQSNGVPAIDSPFQVSGTSALPTNAGQAIVNPPSSFPTARDTYNNFPSTNQFWVSPDGNTILIADSRTDSLGGVLEYYQTTPGTWTLLGHLQLNSFTILSATESGTTVTITYSGGTGNAATDFPAGQKVEIDGVGAGYNGSFTIAGGASHTFTYTSTSTGLATVSGAGVATSTDGGLRALVVDGSGNIFATTTGASANRLVKITGLTTDGSTPAFAATVLSTAASNTAYRGVALTPTAPGTTASTTTLAVTNNPAPYGTGVTLTATVTSGATGWVSFQENGIEIGAAPIISGTATFVTAGNLFAGSYSVVAVYTGDGTYAASTSSPQSATINKASSGTTLTVSANPVATGVPITLKAVVTVPAGTLPTGTVTFFNGATQIGSPVALSQLIVNVSGSAVIMFQATTTYTFTAVGTANLSAVYNGDVNFNTSTGNDSETVVNPSTTVVTTSNANPTAATPVMVTLTATVSGTAGTPTGTVQFYDDMLPIGTPVTLNGSGVATETVNTALLEAASGSPDLLTPGLHSITAVYAPDSGSSGIYFASTGVYEQAVQAQAFGTADQYVERVGDGTTNLIAQPPNPNAGNASTGATIYIDEYTPGGTLVQSIILPTFDGTGSQSAIHAIVADAQQSATGQLTLSGDGQYLFLTGYDSSLNGDPGVQAAAPELHYVNTTSRAVARIGYNGTIQTIGFTAGSSGVEGGGNINGVYSPDGNQFYVSGFNGVYYSSSFTPSTALQSPTLITNISYTTTGLEVDGPNLVAVGTPYTGASLVGQFGVLPTSGKATITAASESGTTVTITTSAAHGYQTGEYVAISGITPTGYTGTFQITVVDATHFTYTAASGLGTATIGTAAAWPVPGPLTGLPSGDTVQQFPIDVYFTHLNGSGAPAGINTMYIADDGPSFANGEISKWALSAGGTWSLVDQVVAGSGNTAVSFYWLNGITSSGNVTLYTTYGNGGNAVTGPGYLYSISDTNGWNAPIGTGGTHSNAVSTVASNMSGSNEVMRGVASAPQAQTVTLVDNGPNPSTTTQAITLTVTVTSLGSLSAPTGSVTLEDASNGNAVVGTGSLSGGTFTFNVAAGALSSGVHNLFVVYGGDSFHQSQNSTQVTQVVNAGASSTTTLTDNGPNPSLVGASVSFTITVSPSVPDGETVKLEDASNGNAVVTTQSLTGSTVTFNVSSLPLGSHNLFAVYGGDSSFSGSQSSQVTQNVLTVIDNGQPGYSETGSGWASFSDPNAYNGNERYAAPGTGANTATWQVTGLAAGAYNAEMTWTPFSNRATNATYQVFDGSTLLGSVTVDQTQAPTGGLTFNGSAFQNLGRFNITSGTLKVVLSDNANGYVIADAMLLQQATLPGVIDNSQYGYSDAGGGWTSFADASAYLGNERYVAPGTGANTATWQTSGLSTGAYDVEVDWTAFSNRADNAKYQIFDGSTLLGTATIDQQLAPSGVAPLGVTSGGVKFQSLGRFTITSGTVKVVLSDNADGYVVADAVYLQPSALPAVIDNTQGGYSDAGGGWASFTDSNAYAGNERYVAPGTGANTATWQTSSLTSGEYDVEVTWTPYVNRADNAKYQVYDGSTLLGTVQVDQQLAPTGGLNENGVAFQSLGRFSITSGTVKVVLSDNADGYVIANAMAVQPATTPALLDNSQYGYTDAGGGWASFMDSNAMFSNERYAQAGSGNTATWQTSGLAAGAYNVEVDWTAFSNRASNATYQVYDGSTLLSTLTVNQQSAPVGGAVVNGIQFQNLGRFPISSGSLKVVLSDPSDPATQYMIADSLFAQIATGQTVIDNSQYGYSDAGTGWGSFNDPNAYLGNERYTAAGSASNLATWQVPFLAAGNYNVQVDWTAFANRGTHATYQVYDGSTLLGTVTIDQTVAPTGGAVAGGVQFQSLGHFTVTSGTLKVVLSDVSDSVTQYIIADALLVM